MLMTDLVGTILGEASMWFQHYGFPSTIDSVFERSLNIGVEVLVSEATDPSFMIT